MYYILLGRQAFCDAIGSGDTRRALELLAQGVEVNQTINSVGGCRAFVCINVFRLSDVSVYW